MLSKTKARREARAKHDRQRLALFCVGVAGLIVAVLGGFDLLEAHSRRDWPRTDGKVFAAEVAAFNPTARRASLKRYNAVITYTYTVTEKPYTAVAYYPKRVLALRPLLGFFTYLTRGWAQAVTDRFPVGSSVTVAYHSQQPKTSVPLTPLFAAFQRDAAIEAAAGVVIALAGFAGLAVVRRRPPPEVAAPPADRWRVDASGRLTPMN